MKVTIEGTPEEIAEGLEQLFHPGPPSVSVGRSPDGTTTFVHFDQLADPATQARDLQRIARDYKAKNGKGLFE